MKKWLSMLLVTLMLLTMLPLGALSVSAAAIDLSTFNSKLAEFKKSVYPEGSTYEDNPNLYGGYECFGFANQIAKYMFGSYPTKSGSAIDTINTNWKVTYGGSAVDGLVIGDIVRFNYGGYDHSIFVTSISGDNIYYCQANVPAYTNKVTYSNKMARSTLENYVKKALNGNSEKTGWVAHYKSSVLGAMATPELTIKYDVNGGTIASNIVSYNYKVTDSAGLNMRKNAGTGYDVLTVLPNNTTFTVKAGDTKTANGYTWGKTTYNGKTGWVVISDFVSKTATNRDTNYYVSSAMVYKSSTEKMHTQVMVYGTSYPDGLYNAATFGLTRSGYSFVGWSTKADGSATIFNQSDELRPEQVYPNIKNGSATIKVYAIWKCNHSYTNACDTSCNVCGVIREVGDHTYVSAVTTAPTCGATGVMTYTCSVCGDAHTELIPATGSHTYDNAYDASCNACGAIREAAMLPVIFGGNSVSEDVSGLAFKFNVEASGMAVDKTTAIYDNATVNGYKLLSMGAVVSNTVEAIDIPAVYLFDWSDTDVTYAVRLINIPADQYDTVITATPYFVLEIDGVATTIYGDAQTVSMNGAMKA